MKARPTLLPPAPPWRIELPTLPSWQPSSKGWRAVEATTIATVRPGALR